MNFILLNSSIIIIIIFVNSGNCQKYLGSSKFSFENMAHYLVNTCKIGNTHWFNESKDELKRMKHTQMKVGVVGAGISGLYASLLLQELGIDYEILEASDRIGGRIHTFHFDSSSKYNYVELGAMRFPKIPEFDRMIGKQNWSLISYLNSKVNESNRLKLIPFHGSHPNNVFYFNGRYKYRPEVESSGDLFGFGKKDGGFIDDKYTNKNAYYWDKRAFDYIEEQLKGNLSSGYDFLVRNDYQTFRGFLMDPKNDHFAYPSDVVDWIEDIIVQTGRFSFSLMDGYLQNYMGSYEKVTIDGGLSKIIQAMNYVLRKKPKTETVVKRVKQGTKKNLVVETNRGQIEYSHIIMTPSFPVLRDIHFDCDLHLKKRIAMRTFENSNAIKVGLKFKSRFWENSSVMNDKPIFGGISETDLRSREVVYPSYGINCSSCPGTILCSYTQYRDAAKFGSFTEEEIAKICLEDLTTIHTPNIEKLFTGKYKVLEWKKEKWIQGAFSTFEPGYFISYYPYLIHPESNGRLHFAGEAISVYHGWTIGCLISAYRAVKDILAVHEMNDKIEELESNWGTIDEPDFTDFSYRYNTDLHV